MSVDWVVLGELLNGDWCWLERTLFDGKITNEYLPCWIAEWLSQNDPQNGVTINKARVIQDDNVPQVGGLSH